MTTPEDKTPQSPDQVVLGAGIAPPAQSIGTGQPGVRGVGYSEPELPLHPSHRRGLKRRLLARWGLHIALIIWSAIFLFPFVWMGATSLKTDEEMGQARMFPTIPTFRPSSPYVIKQDPAERPGYVDTKIWDQVLPQMREEAMKRVAATTQPAAARHVNATAYHQAAAERLLQETFAKVSVDAWKTPRVMDAYRDALSQDPSAADAALNDTLARLEVRQLQMRTVDAEIFNLMAGPALAGKWQVESGPASIEPDADGGCVKYAFDSGSADPVVLRCEFTLPATAQELHKLIVTVLADDTWDRVNATLDLDGTRWQSARTFWMAQNRASAIVLQMPSYEDDTFKPKLWIPLEKSADAQPTSNPSSPRPLAPVAAMAPPPATSPAILPTTRMSRAIAAGGAPARAVLRLIVQPSSTAAAIYGKVARNYQRALLSVPFWQYILNSVILVLLNVIGAVFSASFVAYAFARLHWPGRSVAFLLLLGTMMLPSQVTMIPSFLIWRKLGWYNTLNPMWAPAWFGGAFFIFLMVQNMKTIPRELEEAARLDGLNAVQTWWYIIIPQVKPSMAAIAIMSFMSAWNEFMGPLIYLRDQAKFPLSLGLFAIRADANNNLDWPMIMAGNMLMTLPVMLIFFIFQRYFIEGMTVSGMKG